MAMMGIIAICLMNYRLCSDLWELRIDIFFGL